MSVKAEWVQKFRVSEANLEKWRNEAGPKEDLLRWCLLNGKINDTDYLEWACVHYELPIVEAQYFSLPADSDFFDRVRSAGPWKADLLPLHEWQGVLLIACVAPIKDAKFDRPHRFVLASPLALNMLWSTLNYNREVTFEGTKRSANETQATHAIAMPPAKEFSLEPAAKEPSSESPASDPLADVTVAPPEMPDGFVSNDFLKNLQTASPLEATSSSAPDGISSIVTSAASPTSSEVSLFDLDESKVDLSSLNFDIPPETQTRSPEKPSEKSFVAPVPPQTKTVEPPPFEDSDIVFETTAPGLPPPIIAPSVPNERPTLTSVPMPGPNPTPSPTPTPPPMDRLEQTQSRLAIPVVPPRIPDAPARPVEHKSKDTSVTRVLDLTYTGVLDKPPSKARPDVTEFTQCASYEDVTDVAFKKMHGIYQKGMLLIFQSGQLRPWRWTGNITFSGKGRPNPINIDTPSIFRIVYSTCLPYHGHVIPNPINSAFFSEFYGGRAPSHVTLMPIMVKGQIAGMLMGTIEGELNLKTSLREMENIVGHVNQAFTRIRGKKAA